MFIRKYLKTKPTGMTKKELKAKDEVLRQAWKQGAINDAWYNKWIEELYTYDNANKNTLRNNIIKAYQDLKSDILSRINS